MFADGPGAAQDYFRRRTSCWISRAVARPSGSGALRGVVMSAPSVGEFFGLDVLAMCWARCSCLPASSGWGRKAALQAGLPARLWRGIAKGRSGCPGRPSGVYCRVSARAVAPWGGVRWWLRAGYG